MSSSHQLDSHLRRWDEKLEKARWTFTTERKVKESQGNILSFVHRFTWRNQAVGRWHVRHFCCCYGFFSHDRLTDKILSLASDTSKSLRFSISLTVTVSLSLLTTHSFLAVSIYLWTDGSLTHNGWFVTDLLWL